MFSGVFSAAARTMGLSAPTTAQKLEDVPFVVALRDGPSKKLITAIAEEHHVCVDLETLPNQSIALSELLKKMPGSCADSSRHIIQDFLSQNPHAANEPTEKVYRFRKIFRKHVEQVMEQTTRAIEKHVRRESLKVHPDRHGERFRSEFQALCDARDCLADPALRRKYLTEMLRVYDNQGWRLVIKAHERWVKGDDREKDDEQQKGVGATKGTQRRAGNKTGQQQQQQQHQGSPDQLRLTGGIGREQPRRVQYTLLGTSTEVRLIMATLQPVYQFYTYVHSLHVIASSGHHEIQLLNMNKNQIREFSGSSYIERDVRFPSYDTWVVSWYVTLDFGWTVGGHMTTPTSYGTDIVLESPEQIRQRKLRGELQECESQIPRRISAIKQSMNHALRCMQNGDREKVDQASHMLHSAVVKGRVLERRVRVLVKDTDSRTPRFLPELELELASTIPRIMALEEFNNKNQQKDVRKQFKRQIAGLLESGDAPNWVLKVNQNDLAALGGDTNRLYQLFIEGKGSLEMDPDMLDAASYRIDLFSTKQCQVLQVRKREIEAQNKSKDEEAEKELNAHKNAVREAKKSLVGAYVVFRGLLRRSGLNGTSGKVVGLTANEDRYRVQCFVDSMPTEVVDVKLENVERFYSGPVSELGVQAPKTTTPAAGTTQKLSSVHETPETKSSLVGAYVFFKCLIVRKELNGALGKVTEFDACTGRYKVRPFKKNASTQTVEEEAAVLVLFENMERYHGDIDACFGLRVSTESATTLPVPPVGAAGTSSQGTSLVHNVSPIQPFTPWNCAACSFEHKGPDSTLESCAMCSTPRGPDEKSYAGRLVSSQPLPKMTAPVLTLGRTKEPGQPLPKNKASAEGPPSGIVESDSTAKTEETIGQHGTKPIGRRCRFGRKCRKKDQCKFFHPPETNTTAEDSLNAVSASVQMPVDVRSHSTAQAEQKTTGRPCLDGMNCRWLRKGTCKFYHPPEQLALLDDSSIVTFKMSIGSEKAAIVVGKKGNCVRKISEASGATVHIEKKASTGNKKMVKICGTQGSVDSARQLIAQIVSADSKGEISIAEPYREHPISSADAKVNEVPSTFPPIESPVTVALSSADGGDRQKLLPFLEEHKDCIKGSPVEFCSWLAASETILNLADLGEAIVDEDYVRETLQRGNGMVGLKGFKRKTFQKAVLSMAGENNMKDMSAVVPPELLCPIGHELMTVDPVVASDGLTYERKAIEDYFERESTKIERATQFLVDNPGSLREQEIVERGICSPLSGVKMESLQLLENVNVRTMARDLAVHMYE